MSKKKFVVGLLGRQGAGKDAVAAILERRLGYKHFKFANFIKLIAEEFGLLEECREDKELDRTVVIRWYNFEHEYLQFMYVFQHYAYARTLLQKTLEPYRVRSLDAGFSAEYRISPRQFQQLLGTEVGRECDENFWVDRLAQDLGVGLSVISDVRFMNELRPLDLLILVDRDSAASQGGTHVSEAFTEHILHVVKTRGANGFGDVPIEVLENHSNSLSKLSTDTVALLENWES